MTSRLISIAFPHRPLAGVMARGFAVWIVIIVLESIHGTLRELYLKPLTGDALARRIGFFVALIIIFTVALASINWIGTRAFRQLLMVGVMWSALTLGFEATLGLLVLDVPAERFVGDYNIFAGGLMGLGLVILFFVPLFAAWARHVMKH